MELQELGELLDSIVWGHRIVDLDESSYVFRPLTLEEKNMANYVYNRALKTTKRKPRKAVREDMIRSGLWKSTNEKDMEVLREELIAVQEKREKEEEANKKRRTPTVKLVRLRKREASIVSTLEQLDLDYTRYVELPSAEHHADYERGAYCLQCSTLSFPERQPVWSTLNDLKEETDTMLVNKLLHLYYNYTIANESQIRELARSGMWRIRWTASKKNRGVRTLFNREMFDLTHDQLNLVYWSQVYDSAFGAYEPPTDEIIDSDKLFDKWLQEQQDKNKQRRNESSLNKQLSKKNSKIENANEVGFDVQGFWSEECTCGVLEANKDRGNQKLGHIHAPSCPYGVYVYHDDETRAKKVEKIQSSNPDSIRRILGNEQKKLAEHGGLVEEQHLRSNDKVRAALGMETHYDAKSKQPDRFTQGGAKPR